MPVTGLNNLHVLLYLNFIITYMKDIALLSTYEFCEDTMEPIIKARTAGDLQPLCYMSQKLNGYGKLLRLGDYLLRSIIS